MDFGSPSTRKLNLPSTKLWLLVPFAVTLFQVLVSTVDVIPGSNVRQHRQLLDSGVHPQPAARSKKLQPKFAVVSGFVSKQTRAATRSTVDKMYMGHLINKACYCDLWGYDFIFNQSWGFPVRSPTTQSPNGPHWLDYGTWHRVPHIQSAMDAGYEWVLYADVDYVFQDMTLPLESFVKEWSHLGKHNVQVFVPCDGNNLFTFSAFAILIRNSDFGRRLVKNWIKISHGLCPNGNFPSKPGEYSWSDSDQPGLWYALAQTHHEFYPEKGGNFTPKCNQDGYLGTARLMGQELNEYMQRVGAVKSADLSIVPDDQPIIWSRSNHQDVFARSGLGMQQTFGKMKHAAVPSAFALHKKTDLPKNVVASIDRCRHMHGCSANYTREGKLDIHCRNGNRIKVVDAG